MRTKRQDMNKLVEERERLRQKIEALQNQLLGIERAISLLDGTASDINGVASTGGRERSRNVKDTVLGLLTETGQGGLSVTQVLELARRKGAHIERGSVSSLLSRLKREGILDFNDGSYSIKRPQKEAPPTQP
jgi:hypothetical protein